MLQYLHILECIMTKLYKRYIEFSKEARQRLDQSFYNRYYKMIRYDKIYSTTGKFSSTSLPVYEKWKSYEFFKKENFEIFLEKLFEELDKQGKEIDEVLIAKNIPLLVRINLEEGFYPGNTEWITKSKAKKTNRIHRIKHPIEFQGKVYSARALAKEIGCGIVTIYNLIHQGKTSESEIMAVKLRSNNIYIPNRNAKTYEYKGEFKTAQDLENISRRWGANISRTLIIERIERYGYTPEEAVHKPTRTRKKK